MDLNTHQKLILVGTVFLVIIIFPTIATLNYYKTETTNEAQNPNTEKTATNSSEKTPREESSENSLAETKEGSTENPQKKDTEKEATSTSEKMSDEETPNPSPDQDKDELTENSQDSDDSSQKKDNEKEPSSTSENPSENSSDWGNATLVELSEKNDYTYSVEKGFFSRSGSSGDGTGIFIGKNFVFKRGKCNSSKRFKRDGTIGCLMGNLNEIWCAKNKKEEAIKFEIKFKSWLISNKKCIGDCPNNNTSFLIIRK